MIQRTCHRCHSVLQLDNEGTLTFCWNCGAPQVTLSEELREQAEMQRAEFEAGTPAVQSSVFGTGPKGDLQMVWQSAITIAALVAAGLSVLAALVPPLELLAWMAPAMVLSIYTTRHRETHITAGVGARVGLVCGIFSAFGMTLAMAGRMLVQHYLLHRTSDVEANMTAMLVQSKAQVVAQSGAAAAAPFDHMINTPELHAGFFLAAVVTGVLFLIVLSVGGGAFAGFIRSRTRTR